MFRFVDVFVVDVSVSRRFDQLPTKGSTLTHQILFINMVIILQSTYQNGFLQWHFLLSHSPCVLLLKYNLHFTLHRHYIVNIFPTFKHFNPSFSPLMRRIKYRTCQLSWAPYQQPLYKRVHIIGPPSHWSPISLVPHLIGPPSHWSPISLIPQLAPMHHSFHWSPISLVPQTHWSPISLVPHLIGPLLIGPPIHKSPTTLFELIGPPSHWSPFH